MSSIGQPGNGTGDYDDGSEPVENFGERVEYLAEEAEDAALRGIESIQGGLTALYDGLAEESSRAFETVERNIEDHPWISLLVGFGLGCLVGSVLLRRD